MRRQKNTVSYFPHDADASDGDTMTIIEGLFGNDGYALWFKLLEKLARTENHYIDINQNNKWQLFCIKAHITPEKAITIVDKLAQLEAIDAKLWETGVIWSDNLLKNITIVYKNRKRELPQKPITTSSKEITTHGKGITTGGSTHSRVEKSRVENIIIPDFIDKEVWEAFLEMRKKKKDIPTPYGEKLLFGELEKIRLSGDDPNEVLKKSIMNGWKGIFPPDKKGGGNGVNQRSPRALPKVYTRPEDL